MKNLKKTPMRAYVSIKSKIIKKGLHSDSEKYREGKLKRTQKGVKRT